MMLSFGRLLGRLGRKSLPNFFLLALLILGVCNGFTPCLAMLAPLGTSNLPGKDSSWQLPKIRVRILEGLPKITMRGMDLRFFSGNSGDKFNGERAKIDAHFGKSKASGASEWVVHCQDDRVRLEPAKGSTGQALTLQAPLRVQSPAQFVTVQGHAYRDEVLIFPEGSLCEVVNALNIEKYLAGLVNAEFNSRWNRESIGAQVIAARTYALFRMKESSENHYDVVANERDQVYGGTRLEDMRANQIVDQTRGLILADLEKNEPLKAFYHSSCGGMTELPEKVWGSSFAGFKKRVPCPYCVTGKGFKWRLDLTFTELTHALIRGVRTSALQGAGLPMGWPSDWERLVLRGRLMNIESETAIDSSRTRRVVLSFQPAGEYRLVRLSVPIGKFRDWVGNTRLRSSLFDFKQVGQSVVIEGRGYGHGVGMCQWGAKAMGDQGFKTAAILKHYYPDAKLRRLW